MSAQFFSSYVKLNINIVCCSSESYVPLTATMLTSLLRNHLSHELLNIYLIHDGISAQTKARLTALFPSERMVIHWIDLNPADIPTIMTLPRTYSNVSCHYYRLAMPYLLPEAISRVIYLDVDLIVLKDIANLWATDLGDKTIGAVQDFLETCGEGIPNCLELGVDPNASYFNSGVLVIDLHQWRAQDISRRAIICRLAHEEAIQTSHYYSHDQFGLNVVLSQHWQPLDHQWNYSPGPDKVVVDPGIVHYYGDVKPWSSKCQEQFRQQFLYYLRQTGYQDYFKRRFDDLKQAPKQASIPHIPALK